MRARTVSLLVALLTLAGVPFATGAVASPSNPAGRFIVTLVEGVDSGSVAEEYRRKGVDVDFVYEAALNGFAGAMSEAQLGDLQRDQRVTRIERDAVVTVHATTQTDATWGLDRADQRGSTLDGTYTYDHAGSGVHAYIVDTGISLGHGEFTGRIGNGFDAVDSDGTADDCNGHGTHVAGTVGGAVYGVAKQVTLHPVRVLDCGGSGTWSGVIAGLDWVTANAAKPAVANMSLGGGANQSVDDAVNRTIGAGVTVVVAAGNGNRGGKEQDACGYSPSRVPAAVTIGATTSSDAKTSWSNYGPCVDLFAPGSNITSAWYTSDSATHTISGTSMAAPHVAGVAALYLEQDTSATPATVAAAIGDAATKNIVTSSKTEDNHLLYSRVTISAPVASGTIAGTVKNADGTSAIGGATVKAGDASGTTAADGTYSFTVAPGTYTVQASADGYDTASRTEVSVTSGNISTVDFQLTAAAIEEPPPGGETASFELTVEAGTKAKGRTPVTSTWADDSAYTGTHDVLVNGTLHKTVSGTTETTHWTGGGSFTYKVCRSGSTTTCSNEFTVVI